QNTEITQIGVSQKCSSAVRSSGDVVGCHIHHVVDITGVYSVKNSHLHHFALGSDPAFHSNVIEMLNRGEISGNLIHDNDVGVCVFVVPGFSGSGSVGTSLVYNNVIYGFGGSHSGTGNGLINV